jgi:hypothetical protein
VAKPRPAMPEEGTERNRYPERGPMGKRRGSRNFALLAPVEGLFPRYIRGRTKLGPPGGNAYAFSGRRLIDTRRCCTRFIMETATPLTRLHCALLAKPTPTPTASNPLEYLLRPFPEASRPAAFFYFYEPTTSSRPAIEGKPRRTQPPTHPHARLFYHHGQSLGLLSSPLTRP